MKNVLINEYKYSILIENIPNNIPRKKLGLIAQDVIRSINYCLNAFSK